MRKRKLPQAERAWISIDPANKSGVAIWRGSELVCTGVLRKIGSKGQYILRIGGKKVIQSARILVWEDLIDPAKGIEGVVVEEGAGRFATAIKSQAKLRGYIEAVCESNGVPYREINVSEWRRVIREAYGVSFPANSKGCKELSKKLVKQEFGIDISDDEADAVLLGRAALRLRCLDWM